LTVAEAVEPLQFQLDPGHTLQVQVVDVNGSPIKDAIVATDTWRGFRSLVFRANSDAEGKIVWNGAPADAMLCDILKSGYMTVRKTPLTAAADAQVVTLHPELEISGKVTDAATGKPIERFRLRTGLIFSNRDSINWSRDEATQFEGGRYRVKFSEPYDGHALQVMADGYLPSTSRPFRPEEGAQTFDFALKRGTGPAGVVSLPDGSPAADAEVALSTKDKRASLRLGRFDRSQNNAEIVKTDAAGRFVFPALENDEPFLLVIIHEAGFAERLSREMQESKEPIVLEPWGRIEGVVRQGVKPEANREVVFYPERPDSRRTHPYLWDYGYTSQTDDQGRFSFDRVMPGRGSAARVVVTEFLGSWQHTPGWQARVEIEPGATAQVAIGGSGRPVVGKIELPKNADIASDWTANEPASIEAWNKSKKLRAETYARYSANLDRSGRFEIPDVPAGDYKLTVPVNNPPSPNACGAGTAIGRAELEFSVPEMPGGRSDEPLELGEIEATMFDTLDVGEAAPDFVAEELSSGSIRMRELRGKLVLLDFWATWCGPCLAAMPNLKQIQTQFGKSDRFALIGLSCDGEAAAAKRYVEANGLAWRHAHVGGTHSRVPTQYTVRSLPATFLIGPDGRVLAKNLRGDELRQAVAAALADKKLFADATTPAARFPLVRFESSKHKTLADRPAVIVLDNADPGFDKDKPGGDSWRLLSTTGAELSAAIGFNCGGSVGGVHRVAIDRRRERIYVAENVARRIVACGFDGQKLWQIEQVEADALAVDEKTGNVWSSGGPLLNDGETVVFDPSGNEVAAFPFRAIDLAYDPHGDAFWLAGYEILKLNREGKPLFRKRVDGWCCASVSVNPTDGSVWLAERQHPDIPRSKNRAWLLGADGSVRREVQLGDFHLCAIACVPRTGDAWAAGLGSGLRRISAAGEAGDAMPMRAYSVSVGRESADVWAANDQEVLKLDGAGKVLLRLAHPKPSQDSLLTAF
jgi:thiol-disulfide isomerase/thioredoxin